MAGEQVVVTRDQLRVVQAVYDRFREVSIHGWGATSRFEAGAGDTPV